jgi:hypothetical protein
LLGPGNQNGLALGVVPLVIAVVIAFVVVRMLVRRPRRAVVDGDVVEVRESERPSRLRVHRPRLPMPRRQLVPRTASEAYEASIELLARWPDSARHASETPAEHARRLRADPIGPSLSRLAADYALAEFGKRTLGRSNIVERSSAGDAFVRPPAGSGRKPNGRQRRPREWARAPVQS